MECLVPEARGLVWGYYYITQNESKRFENEFSPLHEKNSLILVIGVWGERKEKENKDELKFKR
jgi:hypothetical protein